MSTPWEEIEDREERLAAEEAARIGGDVDRQESDPAWQAVEEAGGGESEGWELAEQDLIRNATHADERSDTVILSEAGKPEKESDLAGADYGEADQTPGGA